MIRRTEPMMFEPMFLSAKPMMDMMNAVIDDYEYFQIFIFCLHTYIKSLKTLINTTYFVF